MSSEPVEPEVREKRQWQVYVWLDKNGEPRCIPTLGAPREENWDRAREYSELPVDSGITGFPPRAEGVFFAVPYAVYRSPITSLPGVLLLCRLKRESGGAIGDDTDNDGFGDIWQIEGGGDGPLGDLSVFEVEQQFHLTTKFFPVAFIQNPPKNPGPFGSGVGADLAIRRTTITQIVAWLEATGFHVGSATPLVTPGHWGISLRLEEGKTVRSLGDGLVLLRFYAGWACEATGMTPSFMTKILKDPWPPSVLKVTAKVTKAAHDSHIGVAKRLEKRHEELMRSVVSDSEGKEVEKYVWVSNGKGPVVVATESPTKVWLIDNRIPSSANPYTALGMWIGSWV